MSNIVMVDFTQQKQYFSADVYTIERNKYQFDLDAATLETALITAQQTAWRNGVTQIVCLVLFSDSVEHRGAMQSPEGVWRLGKDGICLKAATKRAQSRRSLLYACGRPMGR